MISPDYSIELSDVWKVFGHRSSEAMSAVRDDGLDKKEVLDRYNCVVGVADVSLSIKPGEIFCIMGLSGSGKSTLVRHINRLLEPSSGSIIVNGTDIMAMDPVTLRRYRNEQISMVFQNFALLPHRSVLDNVAMPLEIRGISKNERITKALSTLARVELTGWENKFAHELSGGMQQRVGLARALATDCEILLMDEPFSALDPLIRRQLQNEFMALSRSVNKTTVFITHDLDEAVRIGDRIAIMRDGRVVQIGTPEDIIMHPADSYVSDFVAGISRLKVVKAGSIMRSLSDYESSYGSVSSDALTFSQDTSLTTLIESSITTDSPLIILGSDDDRIGVVTRSDLLRIVIEGELDV